MDAQGITEHKVDEQALTDRHWAKVTEQFKQAGYREGIAAGKDALVQQGFDEGFAQTAPDSRQIGLARGMAAALLAYASSSSQTMLDPATRQQVTMNARSVVRELATVLPSQLTASDTTSNSASGTAAWDLRSLGTTMDEMRPQTISNAHAQLANALDQVGLSHILWTSEL